MFSKGPGTKYKANISSSRKCQDYVYIKWEYLHLQTYYHSKLDFQKVDQHTGCKWLIHGTKRRKDNQLQSLELPSNANIITTKMTVKLESNLYAGPVNIFLIFDTACSST